MKQQQAIFIFTKDKPETLRKTVRSIQDISITKYIIDDSSIVLNRQKVFELCMHYKQCIYLGNAEYDRFASEYMIEFPKFDFLLRPLGSKEWNLGYARNFALLYSKSLGLEKVLFTDDDIEVLNLNLIQELFQSINNYQFVGANISGLVDDSVLGHIATDMGVMNERMISGGFMVFNPNKIDHFFLNNYNEDWIWLFLQLKDKRYLQTGEVFQELTDPLSNYKTKVLFQEFGEIALDGILDLYKEGSYSELTQLHFWERIVKEREEYLTLLATKAFKENKVKYSEIIGYIKSNFGEFTGIDFKDLFNQYFNERDLFQEVFKSMS